MSYGKLVMERSVPFAKYTILTLLLAGICSIVSWYAFPDFTKPIVAELSRVYQGWMYKRELRYVGLKRSSEKSLREILPVERSNLWWLFNRESIARALKQTVLIRDASVTRCSDSFFDLGIGCYLVRVEEREPFLVAPHGADVVIMDIDGATLATVSSSEIEAKLLSLIDPNNAPPVTALGVVTDGVSQEIVRARFQYLKNLIELSERSNFRVARIELLSNGESLVKFGGVPFPVRFDNTANESGRLSEELSRLKRLLIELKGREQFITHVDLAYDKLAVVGYTEEYLKLKKAEEAASQPASKRKTGGSR